MNYFLHNIAKLLIQVHLEIHTTTRNGQVSFFIIFFVWKQYQADDLVAGASHLQQMNDKYCFNDTSYKKNVVQQFEYYKKK